VDGDRGWTWLQHAVSKRWIPSLLSPMPSRTRDYGMGGYCPTECELMRSSLPHGANGLEPRIRSKQKHLG
jgi:hypothetical protein